MTEGRGQPGGGAVTLIARSRGLNVIGRFATGLCAIVTGRAGTWRNAGMAEACGEPGAGSMTLVAGSGCLNMVRWLATRRGAMAGTASTGGNARVTEGGRCPGQRTVTLVARGRGLNVVCGFPFGLSTVVARGARAGRNAGVREACAAPGHRRIVATSTGRRGWNVIGWLYCRRATAPRRVTNLTLPRRTFENACSMTVCTVCLLVRAGERKARRGMVEIGSTPCGECARSEKSGKQHQDDQPQRAACTTGRDVFVKIFHNIYLSSCFVTSIGE